VQVLGISELQGVLVTAVMDSAAELQSGRAKVKVFFDGVVHTVYCIFCASPNPVIAVSATRVTEPSEAKEKTLPATRPCAASVSTVDDAAAATVTLTVSEFEVLRTLRINACVVADVGNVTEMRAPESQFCTESAKVKISVPGTVQT